VEKLDKEETLSLVFLRYRRVDKMKHIITEVYPDCPKCGKEMHGISTFKHDGKSKSPYGTRYSWWECECGYKTKEVRGYVNPERKEEIVKED